jgi:hypothetical protein
MSLLGQVSFSRLCWVSLVYGDLAFTFFSFWDCLGLIRPSNLIAPHKGVGDYRCLAHGAAWYMSPGETALGMAFLIDISLGETAQGMAFLIDISLGETAQGMAFLIRYLP